MTDRPRIKIPSGLFDLELPDGTVLRGAHVAATDRRSVAPDVRIAGTAWADRRHDEEQAEREAAKRVAAEQAAKAKQRAEQSARDRAPRTGDWWNKGFDPFKDATWSFKFDFEDVKAEGFHWRGRQQQAYTNPPPPKPAPQFAGWRTALGFAESDRPSISEVKRRHRQRMTAAHPDAGGSHEAAVSLNRAMDDAKRELRMGAR